MSIISTLFLEDLLSQKILRGFLTNIDIGLVTIFLFYLILENLAVLKQKEL